MNLSLLKCKTGKYRAEKRRATQAVNEISYIFIQFKKSSSLVATTK